VFRGDAPQYLVAAHSFIKDKDFDLKNNYDNSRRGGWDMGARLRGRGAPRHVDRDAQGKQLGVHSPFFSLLLALIVGPFASEPWVESCCIWLTVLVALTGLYLFCDWVRRERNLKENQISVSLLLLGLGTSLLCFSRDLWTEPWILTIWIALLLFRNLAVVSVLGILGTLIKYPFAVVPLTMGLYALLRRQVSRGTALVTSALVGIVIAIVTIQWLFRDVEHFSLLHSGAHLGFDLPFDGLFGLLLNPQTGILLFFPFLAWGFRGFGRGGEIYLPALAFFLVHASYSDWPGGVGFAARYLVPLFPILLLDLFAARRRGIGFLIAALYSLAWGTFGGFFPALVYNRAPWEIVSFILAHL
jgi:hypothetical protein